MHVVQYGQIALLKMQHLLLQCRCCTETGRVYLCLEQQLD
jgi:hypothetical protein